VCSIWYEILVIHTKIHNGFFALEILKIKYKLQIALSKMKMILIKNMALLYIG